MFRIYDGRDCFYQWDIDRKIIVEDSSITQVHFCNRTDDCSLICEVYDEDNLRVVNVPNILLQASLPIRVYGYDGDHTEYCKYFNVYRRTKPADYVYTETEVKNYDSLIKRIEQIEQDIVTEEKIGEAVERYLDENDINVDVDLTGYATEEYVNAAIEQVELTPGPTGPKGEPGKDGVDGYTPVKGVDYFDGEQGPQGLIGPKGEPGPAGEDGYTPVKGVDYFDGAPGAQGPKGDKGDTGAPGAQGEKGDRGEKGETGATGPAGKDGYTPIKGVDYFDGAKGDKGDKGDTGPKGDKGDTGAQGPAGKDGYTPVKGVDYFDGEPGKDGKDGTNGRDGIDGRTPVKNVDYFTTEDKIEWEQYIASELAKRGQLKPEFANSLDWLKANGDKSKLYVLPDNYIYSCVRKEVTTDGSTVPNFTNLFETAIIKEKKRYSLSGGAWKDYTGYSIVLQIPTALVGKSWTLRVKPFTYNQYVYLYGGSSADTFTDSLQSFAATNGEQAITVPGGYSSKYITFATGSITNLIITANEEITYTTTEGSIEIVETWASTGHAFVPADYEDRIVELEADVEVLNAQIKKTSTNQLAVSEVFAPSPQLPADGSETADFNGDWDYITAEHIYNYVDALLNKYPRFITKEVMGKDASGAHDWCRYVCCRRTYDAWQKPNYPPMYGWVNGSTVIYSVSVSPRIGDTLYTTAYVGTAKGTVTAVNNANQSRTVGGVAYTRDKSKDIDPTLVYTNNAYSPYFSSNYAGYKNEIYDSSKTKISTVSSMANGVLTGANGITYSRYPLGDRDSGFNEIPAIVIGGNEHGTGGDPATPAMITARIAKDLCECKNMDNPFLNLLKNEYMVVLCPVVNPWGLHKDNKSYTSSTGVNLDRNFDTPGWHPQSQEKDGWNTGEYGGSENETQYFMNTLVASKCNVAMCNHSYGQGIDSATKEAVSAGICSYMLGGDKPKYTESLLKIAEVMASNYNLVFNKNSDTATPDKSAKTRSYFEHIGIDGIALEINSREGFITDPTNEAKGKQFTARVMEAGYTQLLQVLYMLISKQE